MGCHSLQSSESGPLISNIAQHSRAQRGNKKEMEGINLCDRGINLAPIKICARSKIQPQASNHKKECRERSIPRRRADGHDQQMNKTTGEGKTITSLSNQAGAVFHSCEASLEVPHLPLRCCHGLGKKGPLFTTAIEIRKGPIIS